MKTSTFEFYLPKELIALRPRDRRDRARMLVYERGSRRVHHRQFSQLPEFLEPGDLLVLNNTKVIPARLTVRKPTGGKLDLLFVEKLSPERFKVMSRGGYTGPVQMPGGLTGRLLRGEILEVALEDLNAYLWQHGNMPLPPYIKRHPVDEDRQWYQTVYAQKEGSIAAPTAGLHFTEDLLKVLSARGVNVEYLTLHVGPGTFLPVKTEQVQDHRMLPERFELSQALLERITQTKDSGHRVIAVGTTVTRALEGYFSGQAQVLETTNGAIYGQTDIFIYPGYRFTVIDALITNFHLPKSTPLMLVSAFCGWDILRGLYQDAIQRGYRFFSYGDGMLIL